MIPSAVVDISSTIEIINEPGLTHRILFDQHEIIGAVDGVDAVKQTIYKCLNTEKYQYVIYSWTYGIVFSDLYGMPYTYVVPEIERRIKEAFQDDWRILDIHSFEFETNKGEIRVQFQVDTVYGGVNIEKAVVI